jgi:SPP1 gp7 family putative phage head morphogenesis protein
MAEEFIDNQKEEKNSTTLFAWLAIRYMILLELYKNKLVQESVKNFNVLVLNSYVKKWEEILQKIERSGSKTRLEANKSISGSISETKKTLKNGIKKVSKKITKELEDLINIETDWQVSTLSRIIPIEIGKGIAPSPQFLNTIITSKPMQGKLLSKWFSGLTAEIQSKVQATLNIGLAKGETIPELTRRLIGTRKNQYKDSVLNIPRRNVEAIVRTAASHVTNQARVETYKANKELFKGWQFVATLDDRTTLICISEDGNVYNIGEGPIPPLHWNCRSTTIPVMKSLQEMGFTKDEDYKLPVGTRASFNGQVAANIKYKDWLKSQSNQFQDRVLGKERAELFRSGKIAADKFVNDKGKTLTLSQLRVLLRKQD